MVVTPDEVLAKIREAAGVNAMAAAQPANASPGVLPGAVGRVFDGRVN
jgi:hypothetical protein